MAKPWPAIASFLLVVVLPNTDKLGLENTDVQLDEKGFIIVDKYQTTTADSIFAVGDVIGKLDLTPVAIAAGRRLSERLFNGQSDAYLDYNLVPTVIFTHPPIATIGLSEEAAWKKYGQEQIKVYRSRFTPMYFALNEYRQKCEMKLVCLGEEEKIIGLHGIGIGVDEMLQGFAVAIKMVLRKQTLIKPLPFIRRGQKNLWRCVKRKKASTDRWIVRWGFFRINF